MYISMQKQINVLICFILFILNFRGVAYLTHYFKIAATLQLCFGISFLMSLNSMFYQCTFFVTNKCKL